MRRPLLLIALALLLNGCGPRPTPISVENRSGVRLESVVLSGTGFDLTMGDIAAGKTAVAQLRHGGDTALAIAFSANGQQVALPPQGYLTGNGLYAVAVVVKPDLSASVDSWWRAD